jgi:uncharacterized metal-binding protein YceD (DUF177 family)
MSEKVSPFVVNFNLSRLPDGETEIAIAPSASERAGLARWAGVESVDALQGLVRLEKLAADNFRYEARFTADVTQPCVVTLEPVRSHIEREFTRFFRVDDVRHVHVGKRAVQLPITAEDDEPEILESATLDVAGPVIEELTLAIDPYPRASGAVFQVPPEKATPRENPFAVLKGLKTKR